MASISTNTYLDGGTARTAGETWTISSSAVLTIRTDSRWHANAPASMTGSLGNVTTNVNSGGGYFIDGTAVRWMPFSSGSGTVPAIGTSITQGGVTGYLLGVWPSYTSAPTAVGAAMPATGFLKFREVTGGPFSAGALTGISADADSADVTGWIEVVMDQNSTISLSNVGLGFKTRGDWFYLDDTTGSVGQILQLPTNGGGTTTTGIAIQIETSPGSGVYEWYPAFSATSPDTGWKTAALTTDARAKAVEAMASGQLRIGSDGTSNIGYVPAAGCKVRIPNVILRQCTTGARATNAAPHSTNTTRPEFLTSNGAYLDIEYAHMDWYVNVVGATLDLRSSAVDTWLTVGRATIDFDDVCVSWPQHNYSGGLIWNTLVTGSINDLVIGTTASSTPLTINGKNLTITNIRVLRTYNSPSSGRTAAQINGSNVVCTNLTFIGGKLQVGSGAGPVKFYNLDFTDRASGLTTSTGATNAFDNSAGTNVLLDGLTFGLNGTLTGVQPYGPVINSNGSKLTVRNAGTLTSPLNCGASPSLYPSQLFSLSAGASDCIFQRLYIVGTRTSPILLADNLSGIVVESCQASYSGSWTLFGNNVIVRATGGPAPSAASLASGSFYTDTFTSSTVGNINLIGAEPTPETSAYVTEFGDVYYTGSGTAVLQTLGSYVVYEIPYWIKGHTAFTSTATVISRSSTNVSCEYQVDTGSGYGGTWKTLNATNLQTETISPSGFKIKIKAECVVASPNNTFSSARLATSTSDSDRDANLYPLDTVTLSFEGLKPGSELRAYVGTDPATAVEIGGTESSGTTFSFTHSSSGLDGYIAVFALGYNPLIIPRTYAYEDSTLLISQVVDRNYVNP